MALYDLYENDLSLFGGDLLVGFSPPLNADADLPELLLQDGFQVDDLKQQAPTPGSASDAELSSPESSFQSVEPERGSLFNNKWLDASTDLLDLLEDAKDDQQPFTEDLSVSCLVPSGETELVPLEPTAQPGATALEILQSLAEDNERILSTSSPPAQPSLAHLPGSDTITVGSSVLMGMLLEGSDKVPQSHTPSHSGLNLDNCMDIDVDEQLVLEASLAPILSPVSPEDIETLLSSGPCSPSSVAGTELSAVASVSFEENSSDSVYDSSDELWAPPAQSKPASVRGKRTPPRSAPYSKTKAGRQAKPKPEDRKLRKKQQNRDAALRYRQKKKDESENVFTECAKLEERNTELKDKVDQMTREIKYLKDLMADVQRARGLKPKKQ